MVGARSSVWLHDLYLGQERIVSSKADMFTSDSEDTDFGIKPRRYQASTYGSINFRVHWYWESDPFDTAIVWYESQCLLKPKEIPSLPECSRLLLSCGA